MSRVVRYDVGELRKPRRLPNGWLRAEAFLTRTGVFTYRNEDGTPRRELRLDAEVFAPESLETFSGIPFTNEHPEKAGRKFLLDAKNAVEFQRGAIENVRRVGNRLAASVLVTHEDTIRELESGKAQISVGYDADLEWAPGEHDGERFDCVQRNIVANHVALVHRGRAGADASVRLDEAESVVVFLEADLLNNSSVEAKPVIKIHFDSVELEVSEDAAKAIAAERAAHEAALNTKDVEFKAAVAKATERLDEADKQVASLKAEVDAARAKADAEARVALETQARKLLGDEAKFDGLDDLEVKRQAAEKGTGMKLEGKAADYVQAMFDHALAHMDDEEVEPRSGKLPGVYSPAAHRAKFMNDLSQLHISKK